MRDVRASARAPAPGPPRVAAGFVARRLATAGRKLDGGATTHYCPISRTGPKPPDRGRPEEDPYGAFRENAGYVVRRGEGGHPGAGHHVPSHGLRVDVRR